MYLRCYIPVSPLSRVVKGRSMDLALVDWHSTVPDSFLPPSPALSPSSPPFKPVSLLHPSYPFSSTSIFISIVFKALTIQLSQIR